MPRIWFSGVCTRIWGVRVVVVQVSRQICLTLGRKAERFSLPPIDLTKGFLVFLMLFREGHLGSFCLDDLPAPEDVQRRSAILDQQR